MIESVRILGWWAMDRLHRDGTLPANAMVVSILNPVDPNQGDPASEDRFDFACVPIFAENDPRVLEVRFWDSEPDEHPDFPPMTPLQAQLIVEFLLHCHRQVAQVALFVHCAAGQSRSAAVGQVAADLAGLPWEETLRHHPRPHMVLLNAHDRRLLMRELRDQGLI